MALSLHTLTPAKGARAKTFRVGRGNASGRGTTAGRGTKGQRARTGGRKRLKLKGLKQMLLSFPKTRGFVRQVPEVHALRIEHVLKVYSDGERITIASLKKKDLIPKSVTRVKLIGTGTVDKKVTIVDIQATASVKQAIEKAGGSFERYVG